MDQLKTIKELINQGDIENALQALEEFLQTEPVGKDEAYYLMGNAYRKLGDWQKALNGGIVVDTERCKGCNLCVVACPLNVISLAKEVNVKGYNYAQQILEDTCNGCSSCATVCPDGCISVYKVKVE